MFVSATRRMDSKQAADKFTKEGPVKTFVFNQIMATLNEAVLIGGKCGLDTVDVQEPILEALFEAACMSLIAGMHNKYNGDCDHPQNIMLDLKIKLAHALTEAYEISHLEEKDLDA